LRTPAEDSVVDARSKLNALRQITPGDGWPEEAKQMRLLFLELCEQLLTEQELLREALAAKGKRRRGKGGGGGGKPPSNASGSPGAPRDHSSEAARRGTEEAPKWNKSRKNVDLEIDRTVLLRDFPGLPSDAVLVRFEEYLAQDLVLVRRNTRFLRARYRSKLTGKSYLAPLPAGYQGGYGPGIRTLSLGLAYGANVTMPLLHRFFTQAGCRISRGKVSGFLTSGLKAFAAEGAAAMRAALDAHPWLQLDDTRSGVRTDSGCCHVLGNDLATYYATTPQGDRHSVIQALFLGAPVCYRLDQRAFGYLEKWDLGKRVRERLQGMAAGAPSEAAAFGRWLDLRLPTLSSDHRDRIFAAAALAGYHHQQEIPRVRALLTDDASLFHGLVDEQALCWIHDARHYQKLQPAFASHQHQLERFRRRYWKLYRQLLDYRKHPTAARRARLEAAFDRLVDARKAPAFLAACIARTRKNRAKLLAVLDHPELPLHNNAAELAVRKRVRKRNVSFGPVSEAGRQAWDTMHSLMGTAEKLGLSFWSYLEDRIHGLNAIPPLPELIRLRAQLAPPHSWST
jgi:hypothetical protein